MHDPSLTILNRYELVAPPEDFKAAIRALASRVEKEGHPGVLSYSFFVNPDEGTARAVVEYADSNAWIGHHDIAMDWAEMKALHAVAKLADVTFLGEMTNEISDWIANSSLKATVHHGNSYVTGFRR